MGCGLTHVPIVPNEGPSQEAGPGNSRRSPSNHRRDAVPIPECVVLRGKPLADCIVAGQCVVSRSASLGHVHTASPAWPCRPAGTSPSRMIGYPRSSRMIKSGATSAHWPRPSQAMGLTRRAVRPSRELGRLVRRRTDVARLAPASGPSQDSDHNPYQASGWRQQMRIGTSAVEPGGPDALSKLTDQLRRAADDGFASAWMANIFGLEALTSLAI